MDKNYCKALEGITYKEWIKLKTAMDREFNRKISENSDSIQITDFAIVEKLIQSQFE